MKHNNLLLENTAISYEMPEEYPPFVALYGIMSLSGFIMGLLAGWFIWGL